MISTLPIEKSCTRCGSVFPATTEHFVRVRRRGREELSAQCKPCRRALYRAWRSENRDYAIARSIKDKRERRKDPTFRDAERIYSRNLKRCEVLDPEKLERRREIGRKARAAKRAREPEYDRRMSAARKARLKSAVGSFSRADREQARLRQQGRCWWCRIDLATVAVHTDHLVPLSRGGSNDPENVVLSCAYCNQEKGAKTPQEFIAYRASMAALAGR